MSPRQLPDLPVVDVLDEVKRALEHTGRGVVVAPPGAGKTTLIPLALLDESWLGEQRIVMLEPRRLSARAAARRMALPNPRRTQDWSGNPYRGGHRGDLDPATSA